MQVSSANSLTWLRSTAASASPMGQASSADGQDGSDETFDAIPNSPALSGLQSPSQMFSPASLNTLISAQTEQDPTGAAQGQASETSAARHHHHRGGEGAAEALDQTASQTSSGAASSTAAASSTDTGAETQLAQLLMTI